MKLRPSGIHVFALSNIGETKIELALHRNTKNMNVIV